MPLLDEIQFRVYRSYVKIPLIFFVPALFLMSLYSLLYFHANSQPFWRVVENQLHEQMGGHFEVGYLHINWALTTARVYDVTLKTPERERVIEVKRAEARVSPVMLVSNRLEFERGRVDGGKVRIAFDEEGELNILKVFGFYERERGERSGERGLAIGFSDLELRNVDFRFVDPRFDFTIEDIDIPKGSVFIEPTTLLMSVDALSIPEAHFRFRPEIFRFPPDRGDWRFRIRDFELRNWRWANQGFTVEHFAGDIDGIEIEASGHMAFPGRDAESPMTYDARATVRAAYHSPLLEYFTHGNIRFDLARAELAFRGDLNEIHGEADVHANVIQAQGIFLDDIRGQLRMENRFVRGDGITGRLYDGTFVADNAFFNIRNTLFGADLHLRDVNPRAFVQDMVGQDQPFLDGALSGGLRLIGEIPRSPKPGPQYGYALHHSAMGRFAEMVVLEPLELKRNNDELFPNQELTLTAGTFAIDQRRLGLDDARVLSGGDRVDIADFYMAYRDMRFDFPGKKGPVRFDIALADIAPYATYYGLDGLQGPANMVMTMEGFFGSPEWQLRGRMKEPAWRVSEMEVLAGRELELELRGEEGDIYIERAFVDADFGRINVTGKAGWFEPPPKKGDPQPWPIWEFRALQPLQLDIEVEGLAMEVVSPLVHPALDARGPVDGELSLSGYMGALAGRFEATLNEGIVREQPVHEAYVRGEFTPDGLRLAEAKVDLGLAGRFAGRGRYGYDRSMSFVLSGEGVELSEIRELSYLPMQLGGRTRFHLTGEGSLDEPVFTGGGQARNLSVDERVFGDVAIAADTIDNVVYISGGLLPWLTASIELPLDGTSPYFARLGMEELELMAVLPELRDHPMLDEVQVTGMTELFFERDFSRYQAIFYLTRLAIESRGQRIRNRGPVVVGYNNGEVLNFQRATFGSRGRFFSLEGAIAFNPSLLDLRVEGDFDLALLESVRYGFPEYFPDFFVEATGYALADMNVRGRPENFMAEGTVSFGPSEWELRFLPEPIAIRSGQMIFGSHGIHIPDYAPIQGTLLGGATRIAGTIGYLADQPRTLDLQMWSHNMSYRIPDLASLAFDTNLTIEADDWSDWESWLIGGEMDILDGVYTQRIQFVEAALTGRVLSAFQRRADRYEASLFELVPILNDIRFDMWVRARDGFRLKSHVERLEMDLEFRFDLLLRDTLANPRVTGDIDIIGGSVGFQGESFEVRSGTVRFVEDLSNPFIDLVAGADIRNTCRESDFIDDFSPTMTLSSNMDATGLQYYHIIMNIRGELNNLDLHMESNPYADQRDILSLLLTGCTVDQLTASSVSRPTLEVALGPLLGRLEREIQDVVAVDEFTIMPGVERTQVRIGDTVTRRLSWRFQLDTGFADATGGQQYQLEYKLSDRWSAELSERSHTETNNFFIDLKLKYRLNLD